jgi:predicted Rossmann fold flavoprotein
VARDGDDRGVIVVGAGAAGLATAVFARQINPSLPVRLLDGAAKPGAKILVSGGSRCNVTNTVVTERDYHGGKRTLIRRVLSRFPVAETVEFFKRLGVPLAEEADGKLFPVSNRSRDVLHALLDAVRQAGVQLLPSTRVIGIAHDGVRYQVETARGTYSARSVVLATGGLSLPKTGSDGAGFDFARAFGHTIVPTTPALAPLLLDAQSVRPALSGVAHEVALLLRRTDSSRIVERVHGPMLWTHFGISGPAALDMSRHWLRAQLEGAPISLLANLTGTETFETLEDRWTAAARQRPRLRVHGFVSEIIPASAAAMLVESFGIDLATRLADLPRDGRRTLIHALVALPLGVTGSRGYNYAEVTAGGVALDEVDPATMQSRKAGRLFLVGEMLDVDGRLGGFNFQWAWSSARVAAEAIAKGDP